MPSSTPCQRQNTPRAAFSLGQPRPVGRCSGWPDIPAFSSAQVDTVERSKEPVTVMTEEANEQHYGNDPAFFVAHLGPNLKYSACEWPSTSNANGPNDPFKTGCTLAEAEAATLLIYQEKAGLSSLPKGSKVLELGCGWGSLTLANAARFPDLDFTAFSNSPQQVAFINGQAHAAWPWLGLGLGHSRPPSSRDRREQHGQAHSPDSWLAAAGWPTCGSRRPWMSRCAPDWIERCTPGRRL